VLFQKMRPFALAFLLMLVFGTLALAQAAQAANNPPITDDQANATGLAAGGIGCVCVLIFVLAMLAVNIAILVWVYKDAQARGAEPMLWLVLVFFTHLVGLIIWLIVRPPLKEPRV
jgi:uncharacterized membrane protein YhaH (DUF805 family)